MLLVYILISTFIVSLISLIGVVTLTIKEKLLHQILFSLVGFSAGSLLGGAFLHLLPEALETTEALPVFYYFIWGIILFFLMEKYFYWRHCHDGVCNRHAFTYLNLVGDGFHNFIDGMVIAASYLISVKLGVVTTLAVVFHEIPQELGDFGVLIFGGFSKRKALIFNFISALTAMAGAIAGYFLTGILPAIATIIVPLTAGGFTYIATSDLIPEMHKESDRRRSALAFLAFLLGIVFMIFAKAFLSE